MENLVKEGKFKSSTEFITYAIDYIRGEKGLEIELKKDIANFIEIAYYNLLPFAFGCLFTYFFLFRKFFFLPALLVALAPFFIKLERKNLNVLRVKV
jgi:hypothetical protein